MTGLLAAGSGLLPPGWTSPAKFYSPADLFCFQIADFKITCIASFFQQKYVDANKICTQKSDRTLL